MLSLIKQTLVVTRCNLSSLSRRFAITLSMILSVALAVLVLAGFLAIAKGFEQTLNSTGSPNVAVILGGVKNKEINSDLPAESIRNIKAINGDIGVLVDKTGTLISSRELVVPVQVKQNIQAIEQTISLRGMENSGASIRENIQIIQGQLFSPGAREILVGIQVAKQFPDFLIGNKVRLGVVDWTVVGYFSAHSSAFESEIWAPLDAVHTAFDNQGKIQSLRLRLNSPSDLKLLNDRLSTLRGIPLIAVTESNLYAAQSTSTTRLIRLFGWPLAILMAIGATAGAINTMMSSVSDRTVEIATFRALGFTRFATFTATWLEAFTLAGVGAALGILASWLAFNGWQTSTVGVNNVNMSFQLTVTSDVMVSAGLLGIAIGLIGGIIPAISACRLPITIALRS